MLARNPQTFADGNAAGALVGPPANMHEAVGTISRTTEQAAGPVIFETAAEDAPPCGKQRHGHRFSGKGFERLALEIEGHSPGIVDLSNRGRGKSNAVFTHESILCGTLGPCSCQNVIGDGVPLRQKPGSAPVAVVPPLPVHTIFVLS